MNLDKLRAEIAEDEGIKFEVYLDHLGLPTVGIGHLIRESDLEHGLPAGTPVSEERVTELFEQDIQSVIEDCERLFSGFSELPEEVQRILANMMFNMGYNRLSQFKMLRAAVAEADWIDAASQMLDSRWARQVPNRANRLIERMKAVA
jgi:lysozyme